MSVQLFLLRNVGWLDNVARRRVDPASPRERAWPILATTKSGKNGWQSYTETN